MIIILVFLLFGYLGIYLFVPLFIHLTCKLSRSSETMIRALQEIQTLVKRSVFRRQRQHTVQFNRR